MVCKTCNQQPTPHCDKNPRNALTIVNDNGPILFHKVTYPASLGDDDHGVKPEDLQYRNVLLEFEANGHVYLYSSDGVPTFISYLPTNTDELKKLIEELQLELDATNVKLDETIERVTDALEAEAQMRAAADQTLAEKQIELEGQVDSVRGMVVAEQTARETADEGLQSQIDAINDKSDVVDVVGTHAELEAYDTKNLGDNDVVKVLNDETHDGAITYYRWNKADKEWQYVGETGPYYTKAEVDEALETAGGPRARNLPPYVLGNVNRNFLQNWSFSAYSATPYFKYTDLDTGEEKSVSGPSLGLASSSTGACGLMSASDKYKLESLLEIKSLNDSLSLDANGQLSVVGGGGSSIDLLGTYTADATAEQAYNAPYINKKLNDKIIELGSVASSEPVVDESTDSRIIMGNGAYDYAQFATTAYGLNDANSIIIGTGAHTSTVLNDAGARKNMGCEAIAIGHNAEAGWHANSYSYWGNRSIAIGASALTKSTDERPSTAIGYKATASTDSVVVGAKATAGYMCSVVLGNNASTTGVEGWNGAIGESSKATRRSEISFGDGSTNANYGTRFLANVRAGVKDTDATNVAQVRDMISEAGGGGVTALQTYTAEPEENDVYSAGYVNGRLNSDGVAMGNGATITARNLVGTPVKNGVAIGENASVLTSSVAIGPGAVANGSVTSTSWGYNVAVGVDANATTAYAIAIGPYAKSANKSSVAIGERAVTSREYEFSIGNSNYSDSAYSTRYLANVRAGELDNDAVNVKQLNDAVGNINTLLETLISGEGAK